MCEICRQTVCPSGCPNAPLWEPPTCDLCDGEARWEYDGVHLCTQCLHESVTEDAEFEDAAAFVSESRDQWHDLLDHLLDTGKLGADTLRETRFDWPKIVQDYCDGNDYFFEFLEARKDLSYRGLYE